MATISEIYEKYNIMPQLRDHMLRAGAVASLVCDNFSVPVDKKKIVTIALLHDMGNIIKFKLDYFPQFLEPQGLAYWQKIQNDFKEKYGNDEHIATKIIIQEIGLPEYYAVFANKNRFSMLCAHKNSDDFEVKIMHYVDTRVSPHGVVSFDQRMEEARERYKDFKSGLTEKEKDNLLSCGKEIEKQIFEKCSLSPSDINDQKIAPIVEELKNFTI